jgi:hypothetical protein
MYPAPYFWRRSLTTTRVLKVMTDSIKYLTLVVFRLFTGFFINNEVLPVSSFLLPYEECYNL